MVRTVAICIAAALLASCTTRPVPEGYAGPLSNVRDTYTTRSGTSADFFVLSEIDGRPIDTSLSATAQANYGRGMSLRPMAIARDVPAQEATFTIVGRTHYGAPILALLNKVYEVSGQTTFAPKAGESYTVKGVLGDAYSAVWIEDSTGAPVGQKIEVKGSSAVGILAK